MEFPGTGKFVLRGNARMSLAGSYPPAVRAHVPNHSFRSFRASSDPAPESAVPPQRRLDHSGGPDPACAPDVHGP
jgi:hypothetical protein